MKVKNEEKIVWGDYIIDRLWDRLTLYALYDNCIELDEEIQKDWRVRTNITWYNELVQISLWFEYDVEYDYVHKDNIEEVDRSRTQQEQLRKWHDAFTSWTLLQWLLKHTKNV
jgi:hypothetical protein